MTEWLPDVLALIGLFLLAYGLYLISLPLALIVTGGVLLLLGILAAARRVADREIDE